MREQQRQPGGDLDSAARSHGCSPPSPCPAPLTPAPLPWPPGPSRAEAPPATGAGRDRPRVPPAAPPGGGGGRAALGPGPAPNRSRRSRGAPAAPTAAPGASRVRSPCKHRAESDPLRPLQSPEAAVPPAGVRLTLAMAVGCEL